MSAGNKNDHGTLHAYIILSTPTKAQCLVCSYLPVACFDSLPMQHNSQPAPSWHPVEYEYAFGTPEEIGTVPERDDDVGYLNAFNMICRGFTLAACLRIPRGNIAKSGEMARDAKVIDEVCGLAFSCLIDMKQDTST
ncbi:hypothetical protein BDQ17DRAFT_1437732 [Cyathus striatus]|nr:hypothetical protein BDQ17DRAFT_1437732 [Cyathus striatus]